MPCLKVTKMNRLYYPKVANFDDKIVPVEDGPIVQTIALPRQTVTIANTDDATIRTNSGAFAVIEPVLGENNEHKGYTLCLSVNNETCTLNDVVVEDITKSFNIGDRLQIGNICIERRISQFKLTNLDDDSGVIFSKTALLEEQYKVEYPIDFPEYRRSPRILKLAPKDKVVVANPDAEPNAEKNEIIKAILPPIVMIAMGVMMTFLMGRNPIMMIGMAGTSLVTASITVSSFFSKKKELKKKKIERVENYDNYLLDKQATLNELERQERDAQTHHYPNGDKLIEMVEHYDSRIYEKTPHHGDFLTYSLGTGSASPTYDIEFSADEQKSDELLQRAENEIILPRRILKNVPITTSLLGETLGLAGSYPVIRTAVSNLLFQIAFFHSYRDVQFITLVPEENYAKDWSLWRWLPHVQIDALNMRGFVHHARSRDVTLSSFYQLVNKRKQAVKEATGNDKPRFSPHYILTILDDSHLAGHGLNEFLAEDMSQYGVTVIWGKDSPAMLPETVTTMIRYYSSQLGELINEKGVYVAREFVPHPLPDKFEIGISRLANLYHMEVEKNAIPKSVTFLEMYNVKKVEELGVAGRWAKANAAKTLAVPLGLRGKDDIVELNLHERAHGPHGLVAGTTGSGKSEIVQSYILSLALNFAPEDVGFLPIDFKGGGMANEFKELPHLLGSITNLDGASSARALASIRAELKKRQRLFAQFGVNHINAYTKLYKQGKGITDVNEKEKYPTEPIPHLFLISDEFAELKANEPDFMAELVSTARIGRSLGVHLILATQKPSGVVDDQIWSNSRFKLALKVADESDSNEIIKTPDAASITEPGRAYLQVGNNEIFELFQSAWSGATYDPNAVHEEKVDERIWLINDLGQYQLLSQDLSDDDELVSSGAEEELPTQLRAITRHIADVSEALNVILPPKPWLPPLETAIITPTINRKVTWSKTRNLSVPLAFMDIPSQQTQVPFIFDLEKMSHTAIYGSAGFGKSTVLQTLVMNLARENNPEQVQVNLLDFGTNGLLPLKDLPHVADLARLEDEEKLLKFLKRIKGEVAYRKELFTEVGVSSLSQYEAKTKSLLPVIVTVLDSYDPLRESPLEDVVESVLNGLLRDGASVGMYVVITAIRVESLKVAMVSNIPTRMGLYLVEENAIRDIVGREALIAQEIVGRGQIKLDEPFSLQFYLPAEGECDLERLNAIETEIKDMSKWKGKCPKPIPMVPTVLSEEMFFSMPQVISYIKSEGIPLGLDMETTEILGYSFNKNGFFLIADGDLGQTEFLEKTIFKALESLKSKRIVLDGQDRFAERGDIFDLVISASDFSAFMTELMNTLDKRLADKETAHEPMLIYIPEAHTFTERCLVDEDTILKLLRLAASVKIHILFHGEKSKIENSYDSVIRAIKSNIPAGMVGSKLNEQDFVKVKSNYSEPMLEPDQHHYFSGRFTAKMKLVSE